MIGVIVMFGYCREKKRLVEEFRMEKRMDRVYM